MATFTRGTALITITQATQLAPQLDLTNLEDGGDSIVDELLITATDWCIDRLAAEGYTVAQISNAEVFERTIAWQFVGLIWAGGYAVPADEGPTEASDRAFALSERFYTSVRPSLSSGDEPHRAGSSVPRAYNRERKGMFDSSSGVAGQVWNDLPGVR